MAGSALACPLLVCFDLCSCGLRKKINKHLIIDNINLMMYAIVQVGISFLFIDPLKFFSREFMDASIVYCAAW